MHITLQYICQRVWVLKRRLFVVVNYAKGRVVLISQCIVQHVLLIKARMLLLVTSFEELKRFTFVFALKATACSLLVLLTLYRSRVSGSVLSTNIQNVAFTDTMHCTCDATTQQSKVSFKEIKNITKYSVPQSQKRISSLNVSTKVVNVDNFVLGNSVNNKLLQLKTIRRVSQEFCRYFQLTINASTTTTMVRWGNFAFDLFEDKIPVSRSITPLIKSLRNSTTIGYFKSIKTTSRNDPAHSEAMVWRTYVEQQHHLLMLQQMFSVCRRVDPRHMFVILYNFLHPDEPLLDLPVLNEDAMNAVGFLTRAYFVPGYLAGNMGDIPIVINVQNHRLLPNNRIGSWESGFVFQLKPLNPTLLLLGRQGFWAEYLQRRVDFTLFHTKTDLIKTNMLEAKINVSAIGLDVLKSIISKTPIIKKATPVVNRLIAQKFLAFEMRVQAGREYSETVNFNTIQELLRTRQMNRYNSIIRNHRQQREVTFFQPMYRRNYANHLAEIHERSFYRVGFGITINFD